MPHDCTNNYGDYCDSLACGSSYAKSDEALDALRRKLTGIDEPYPQCTGCEDCDYPTPRLDALMREPSVFVDEPVVLTVYTAHGNVTVENVAESSIRLNAGVLTCEEQDGSSKCPLFTFGSVQGYRTTFR